ncbi:hypothetical protein RZS08_06110 [Arthrospira platensis SPKY1]|nr:hypothetical protein [Arthrospira platensis SPKY1]
MFSITSRYYGIETAVYTPPSTPDREIIYLRRRFLPPVANSIPAGEHSVGQGERLDNITAAALGDPEQFWRLCDANNAMHPNELTTEIGRRLIIPVIQGGT